MLYKALKICAGKTVTGNLTIERYGELDMIRTACAPRSTPLKNGK